MSSARPHKKPAHRKQPRPAGTVGSRPVVAIVGRPNVGKSTLFNRLVGGRLAIVEDIPGVTRDRNYADAWMLGREVVVVDTGGFDPEGEDPFAQGIAEHVRLALEEADVVVCVLDATSGGATPLDEQAVDLLRRSEKPVVYVANKADSPARASAAMALYETGVDTILPVAAAHGRGIGELEDAIVARLPEALPAADAMPDAPRLAIVGRPNAGKSSWVNRLLGEERQLVDARPGTTVDAVDTWVERDGQALVLIDTAGIRRKRAVRKERGIEALGVMKAIRSMERAHVVVLMIDGRAGVAEQDARLAGLAVDRGRALVVGVNKVDLLSQEERAAAITRTKEVLAFAPWASVVPLSAETGRGAQRLWTAVQDTLVEHRRRVTTAELNRFFETVLERHPPPIHKGKAVRLYFVTQAQVAPPTFMVSTNHPEAIHFSYARYVQNQIRERFGFAGTPIRVFYRKKRPRPQ